MLHVSAGAALLLLGLLPFARARAASAQDAPPTIVIEPPQALPAEPQAAPPEQDWEVTEAPSDEEPEAVDEVLDPLESEFEVARAEPAPEDLAEDPWADVPLTLVLTPRPPEPEPEVEPQPAPEPAVVATPPPAAPRTVHLAPVPIAAKCKRPRYPDRAARNGWEGIVVCRVTVGVDGKVVRVTVEESSGHKLLDDAAVDALETWRFLPGRKGDEPVQMDWIKRLQFKFS